MNKSFASSIRKGLKTGARHKPNAPGMDRSGAVVHADTIGLALIGELGEKDALEMVEKARKESAEQSAGIWDDGPATFAIFQLLGITQEEAIRVKRLEFFEHKSPIAIAMLIERGKLHCEPA
jgi:hypothetical protein